MNTKLLITAISFILIGSVSSAKAAAVATSGISVSNFKIYIGSDTSGSQLDATNLSSLSYTSSASTSATLNGVTSASGTVTSTDASTGIDLLSQRGVSNPAHTNNVFNSAAYSSFFGNPLTGANFAFGDQYENGSPITGIPNTTSTATLFNQSTVSIDGTGVGGATSNNGLVADWRFQTGFNNFLTFSYDVSAYLESFLSVSSANPSSAQSGGSIEFKLVDLSDIFQTNLLVGDISRTWSTGRNAPLGNGLPSVAGIALGLGNPILNVPLSATTSIQLLADRSYSLTANIFTSANAQSTSIPEPSVLGLMGLGLLGMASLRKRIV